jgi:hypothetical protein
LYSVLDDKRHAHKVNEVLSVNPNITRKQLSSKVYLCDARLVYLDKQKLINIQHTYRRIANDAKTNEPVCE